MLFSIDKPPALVQESSYKLLAEIRQNWNSTKGLPQIDCAQNSLHNDRCSDQHVEETCKLL